MLPAPTGWSAGRYFRISKRPSPDEVARGYDILRRHLEADSPPATARAARVARPAIVPATATVSRPRSAEAPEGSEIELDVQGRVEMGDLTLSALLPFFKGDIQADGEISSPNGIIEAPRFTLTADGSMVRLVSIRSPAAGQVAFCAAGGDCEAGTANADGNLAVGTLDTREGLVVGPGGLQFTRQGSFTGTGGGGFFEVDSVTNVNVDNNASECPAGRIVVGVRLWETDSNQVGIQVQCSAP